jgi:hypothetical protein
MDMGVTPDRNFIFNKAFSLKRFPSGAGRMFSTQSSIRLAVGTAMA